MVARRKAVKQLRLTLVKSAANRLPAHRCCVRGLGLRKTQSSSIVLDTPENRGMINKIAYMLRVEEVS